MKEKELREIANCALCGKPFGHTGLPLFYRVTIERFKVDMGAVDRQQGLGMMLGNASLASVMGTNEDMAESIMEPIKITVCEHCSIQESVCIAELAER